MKSFKRTIQSELENPLAKAIISGKIKETDTVIADKGDEGIVFKKSTKG